MGPRECQSAFSHSLCPATLVPKLFLSFRSYLQDLPIILTIKLVFLMILYIALCMLFCHVSDAAPISSPLPTAISGLCDAWASLVANVAPTPCTRRREARQSLFQMDVELVVLASLRRLTNRSNHYDRHVDSIIWNTVHEKGHRQTIRDEI